MAGFSKACPGHQVQAPELVADMEVHGDMWLCKIHPRWQATEIDKHLPKNSLSKKEEELRSSISSI